MDTRGAARTILPLEHSGLHVCHSLNNRRELSLVEHHLQTIAFTVFGRNLGATIVREGTSERYIGGSHACSLRSAIVGTNSILRVQNTVKNEPPAPSDLMGTLYVDVAPAPSATSTTHFGSGRLHPSHTWKYPRSLLFS
jgi:hypothetical protein